MTRGVHEVGEVEQFPHRAGQTWAALPEAWREAEGTPFDPKQVPEELHDYLSHRPGTPYRDMKPKQKAFFIFKLAVCILTFGMAFPNVMSD